MNREGTELHRRPGTAGQRWPRTLSVLLAWGAFAGGLGAQEAAAPAAAPPAEPAAATPLGRTYQDFQAINDRNIFNPNRTRRSRYAEVEEEKPKEPKIEVVALTGTLSYAKGTVAFFDSASSEFRKAAKVGDQIAGYLLKEIAQSQVALERESQLVQLKVGQQLRRQDEGPWEVTSDAVINSGSNNGGRSSRSGSSSSRAARRDEGGEAATTAATPTPGASSSGEGPSEALKRLLEQRKKEQAQ